MTSNMTWQESYDDLWSKRDKRLDGWFMMDSPVPTVALSASYVLFVTLIGPRMMRDRKPFENLKMYMQVYNVVSVAISAYIMIEAGVVGWFGRYNMVCQNVEYDPDPSGPGMRMAVVVYFYYLSKFLEFFDTAFMVARKKFGNITVLHVFHHGIMPVFSYCLVRWLPGGQESFGGFMNSIVHVIMYSYYFLAALGPHMQKYLWWKKYLTTFQMIQFAMVFVKSCVVIFGIRNCGYPWQFSLITASLMVIFFSLFFNFYIQEYNKRRVRRHDQGKADSKRD